MGQCSYGSGGGVNILILGGRGTSTNILFNSIRAHFPDDTLLCILDAPIPKRKMLAFRFRKLGLFQTVGQVMFMIAALPVLRRSSQDRVTAIHHEYNLNGTPVPECTSCKSDNVNSTETIDRIREFAPDVILVNGTRILRAPLLSCTDAPVINTHAGVTPMYRGVHGGYWSLWNRDADNFGTTVHFVDTGVDSGAPIEIVRTRPERADNFASYPVLQQAIALPVLHKIIESLKSGRTVAPSTKSEPFSKQWYHPTLWGYLLGRLRGVK